MATSSSQIAKSAATGILQSSLSPKYLHTNSTSHTWPFSAIAELIDNAYDPDVKASQLWIDKIRIHGQLCLTFTDNGNGMQPDKLHKMLSFGFCEKVADGSHMPVGHYGNGFKSGSMRLGKDALVLTKQENTRSVGYLSQTYLELIKAETVVVPIVTWDKKENDYVLRSPGIKALKDIFTHSLIKSEDELNDEFDKIPIGNHGTRIIISHIRKTSDNKPEFDFVTDEYDIRIPDDSNSESEKYRRTKRQNHVPECDYSLRAYCAILYLKPKMQIILRQKKVKTLVVEKSLSQTEVDRYKPTHAATGAVKVVFGFNSRNKNHYGIMMYHRNRLIKPYERVGHQLKANNLGVGVVGVVQCDFLQPTHNKQDFDYTKAYRACIYSLGVKLNEYWNEKKGPVRSSSQINVDQPMSEPQEIQSIPDQTWVQCDEPTCLRWRKLRDGIDPDELPEKWFCSMNPDVNFKSCDVPEEKDEDTTNITPYAKVQKSRLVREVEEKKKREKAAKLEQEEKLKMLEKKEEILKKKEEFLNKKLELAQRQESKPKIKVEGGSLPTAQVAPRPTTKPLNAVTPTTAKPSPRQIGSQLAARLVPSSQSPARTAQSNQSARSPAKPTLSPARSLARSTPSQTLTSQSTLRSALSSQSTPRLTLTNQSITVTRNTPSQSPSNKPTSQLSSGKAAQLPRTPTNTQFKLLQPKTTAPQTVKLVTQAQAQKLGTTGITFKMMKTKNGSTYLVQEKTPLATATTTGTTPYATVVRASGPTLAAIAALGKSTPGSSSSQTVTVTRVPNTSVDVKPRLNVLPKPQTSLSRSAELLSAATTANDRVLKGALQTAAKQKIVLSALNSTKTVAMNTLSTDVKPSHSLAATAYSEITGNTSTTPQDVKNILQATAIKREAPDSLVSPIPAKVQRRKSDAAVIVIDPLPSQTQQRKQLENPAEKRVKELEARVKELEKQIENIKSDGKEEMEDLVVQLQDKAAQLTKKNKEMEDMKCDGENKMAKVVIQLEEKSAQLIKRNKEIEEKRDEINSKTSEVNEKVRELKVLRGNVCKLLQVLVPEIDVECENDGETVDDLLKQVLEANQ